METLKSCPFEEPVGKYEIENDKPMMTNKEWLHTLNVEQVADVLWEQINGDFNSGYACCNLKQDKDYVDRYKRFIEWLKQPHTTIKG